MIPGRTKQYYQKEFVEKQRSPSSIAEEWNTYSNKIRRELKYYGFSLRDRSEAQSLAIKCGRHPHPTRGHNRPPEIKLKISEAVARSWQSMDEEERKYRSDLSRDQWERMPEEEKKALKIVALNALRETTRVGSKLEKFLYLSLKELGYAVDFHAQHILSDTHLQTDLYLPTYNCVIEVDGPSHFFPIWGQETLEKNILSSAKKNNLLLTSGFVVIRIKHLTKSLSDFYKRKLLRTVVELLEKIKLNFPLPENRLIEVELPYGH